MFRNSEPFVVIIVLAFVTLSTYTWRRDKERRERLALIEKALKHGNLDEQTRQALVDAVKPTVRKSFADRWHESSLGRFGLSHLLVIAGWIGAFLGVGLLCTGSRYDQDAGLMILLLSVGVITVPFAVREFERRKSA